MPVPHTGIPLSRASPECCDYMAEHGLIRTGYAAEIPLGVFCADFRDCLLQEFPDWLDSLELLMDQAGTPLALQLSLQSPNRVRNVVLAVRADEAAQTVLIEFNGAAESFQGAFEAVRYIGFIVHEEIICVSHYVNSQFSSSRMTEAGMAL